MGPTPFQKAKEVTFLIKKAEGLAEKPSYPYAGLPG